MRSWTSCFQFMEEIFWRARVKKKKESISKATGACVHKSDKSQPEKQESKAGRTERWARDQTMIPKHNH